MSYLEANSSNSQFNLQISFKVAIYFDEFLMSKMEDLTVLSSKLHPNTIAIFACCSYCA